MGDGPGDGQAGRRAQDLAIILGCVVSSDLLLLF